MKKVCLPMAYLLALICLIFSPDAQAQTGDDLRPDRPILESVDVNPTTGLVTIKWDMPQSTSSVTADEFVLYWYQANPSPNYVPFVTLLPGERSYTFNYEDIVQNYPEMPDPRKTTVFFSVATRHVATDIYSLRANADNNLQVSSKYDSCRAEIRLNWHRYEGWTLNAPPNKSLVSYHVMRIPEGGGSDVEVEGGTLSPEDTVFIITNVNENDKYTYYIKAKRSDEVTVTSYQTVRETKMPVPPTYIAALGTEYGGDGLAKIHFEIDPSAQTHIYELYGSSRHEYSFVSLGMFNIHGDTTLTDKQMRGQTHYYRLEAWHLCKNKYTATSNMATALWLSLKQDGATNQLSWEPYQTWGDDARYEVYRKIGTNDSILLTTIADPATTEYRDDLSRVLIDGDLCYWIIARPVSPNMAGQQASSNHFCIKPESDIFIPQAFIPTSADPVNSEFKPFFSYPPQEYMLHLYDRTGAKVFETTDINAGWNGRLMNGKPASEGVYVYYLKFRTTMNRLVERRGTFSLIIP